MLDLAFARRQYLVRLSDGPARIRDLVEEFEHSRSTVNRAIRALEEDRLVERGADGYETTFAGRILLDTVDEATAVAEAVESANDVLNELPSSPRNHRFLADAEVVTIPDTSPAAVLSRLHRVAETADRLRGASIAANDEQFVLSLYRRTVVEESLELSYVVTESVADYLAVESPERARSVVDAGVDMSVVADLPFAWYLSTVDGRTTAYLAIHSDKGTLLGYAANDDPGAVEWLAELFDAQRDRGTSLAAYYRSNDGDAIEL
ncbi:Predicted transcriptional regulator, contains HTH domain [Halorubrum xinjiangense]|uniref:Predicted transcriptional regulator, contains HTH domain n=1 Tax=Halorubrum xinjiangense TaxID=261291 RepID=A0A1G7KW77_9EURY|nr:MarR family transcriptional regulator [Halorubrum xinjiangense]SDF41487.1 Predicted transcriptional regulator, contains HTH domain [Halorubrum xinjiangense]